MIYWYLIPAFQFLFAVFFVDTWQYFLHRAMHLNKWLYTTFHSRHHRLYVPYAFGALYNHPVEGFLLDTAGTGLAFLISRMSSRQAMWFFTCSTIKTIDDHCGYAFPFDPLQKVTSNNAAYHDIHHQSWGIKTNFSQPFFTFWDRLLNTRWNGDVTLRYERSRLAAQRMVEAEKAQEGTTKPGVKVPPKEEEESNSRSLLAKTVCKKTTSFSSQTEPYKGASHRINSSIRQK
ncbi:sphingosine hydroxylase [Coccidioides immitis H538.4]|uniref:Sphingosine hydroxylase n=1 Tax=Coccidioides immitis H538.4 TaxID=396776 RepID=A0A0J8RBF5_COCIT|nr:sphingosine hydroxylase [Coccidioides immitis H538.4]